MTLTAVPEFSEWYRSEHPRVLGSLLALSGDADVAADVTADAFARALAHWPRVAIMASPAGWTYQVALNGLRRRHRRRGHERRVLVEVGSRAESARGVHLDATRHPEVWEAVRELPEKQRTAIVLRYVADLAEADIAKAMGVSRGTVASNLADARRALARYLGDENGDAENPIRPGDAPRPAGSGNPIAEVQ
jgi:RNA polymerase sigma-70 factor (ECF subfamily)